MKARSNAVCFGVGSAAVFLLVMTQRMGVIYGLTCDGHTVFRFRALCILHCISAKSHTHQSFGVLTFHLRHAGDAPHLANERIRRVNLIKVGTSSGRPGTVRLRREGRGIWAGTGGQAHERHAGQAGETDGQARDTTNVQEYI